ncbi:high affinity 3',5'-cyclic-AMP phosphodiesterase 7A-like isoform X2 [Liolophura sinensis]
MLGDVRVRPKPDTRTDKRQASLTEAEHRSLEKLALKEYKTRCGLRFRSVHKSSRHRQPIMKLSPEIISLLDGHYSGQAQCLLSCAGDWTFDVFQLDRVTGGRSLLHVALHVFQEHDLIRTFQLDIVKLMRCITLVEEGYHGDNPYHNAVHAADVTQAMHCYLLEKKLKDYLTPIEKLVAIFAAMTHDLDHPGVNQAFLIATTNHLASLYNNSSVLENHHWRTAIAVLHESELLNSLDAQQWQSIEWQLRSLILATDITRQQEFLTRFKKILDGEADFEYENNFEHRHFLLQIALKCADICNPCRPWEVSKRWGQQVCEEFFKQGDCERQLQLPVTPNCDRNLTTVAKINAGFMEYVCCPLFREWHRFDPSETSAKMLENINYNQRKWQGVIEAEKEQMIVPPVKVLGKIQLGNADSSSNSADALGDRNDDDKENCPLEEQPEEEGEIVEITQYRTIVFGEIEPRQEEELQSTCRSLSPVSEDLSVKGRPVALSGRRHSMPHSVIRREYTRLTVRRESFPRAQYSRRRSLPKTPIYQATSFDTLVGKLSMYDGERPPSNGNKTLSLETLISRPKISNLSPNVEASQLVTSLSKRRDLFHVVSQNPPDQIKAFSYRRPSSPNPVRHLELAAIQRGGVTPTSITSGDVPSQTTTTSMQSSCSEPISLSQSHMRSRSEHH